ncbi:MAG: TIM barrel protein [Candidatus Nanoarchaeia archaeon]|nr:TIM barrel protein [Candidatus Nanoarchaeia archaeon]
MKIGAKTNLDDIGVAKALAKEADFIEIYYTSGVDYKKMPKAVYTMHCPHHDFGVNLALLGSKSGVSAVKDSLVLAEKLKCKTAIVHTGTKAPGASVENMIKNLKGLMKFAKSKKIRLLIENLPYMSNAGTHTTSLPGEYKKIIDEIGCGFCLDFSHAIHSAFAHKTDYKKVITDFLKLKPEYFHLYNTNMNQANDVHLSFDDENGNIDFDFILPLIPKNAVVALELPDPKVKNFINAKKFLKSKGAI